MTRCSTFAPTSHRGRDHHTAAWPGRGGQKPPGSSANSPPPSRRVRSRDGSQVEDSTRARKLRARRRLLRLTQTEVADLAGTTQRSVSQVETGKASVCRRRSPPARARRWLPPSVRWSTRSRRSCWRCRRRWSRHAPPRDPTRARPRGLTASRVRGGTGADVPTLCLRRERSRGRQGRVRDSRPSVCTRRTSARRWPWPAGLRRPASACRTTPDVAVKDRTVDPPPASPAGHCSVPHACERAWSAGGSAGPGRR